MNPTMERAVETLAHQIACQVHGALAYRQMTTAELKQQLLDIGSRHDLVDELLAAEGAHEIRLNLLSDIAEILALKWRVNMEDLRPKQEAKEDTKP